MDSIEFIDCNCMIGERTAPLLFEPRNTEDIKRILVANGIGKALVYHSRCLEYHPLDGNKTLMNDLAEEDFFLPVWVVMPGYTGEFPRGDKLKSMLTHNNVRALKAQPEALGYSMSIWSMGEIYGTAQALSLPIIIQSGHISWDMLHIVLLEFPALNIILTSSGYRMGRYLYPLMMQHENLYLEISMYKNHMGIEHLYRMFGSERILYGSGLPEFSPGCAKAMILNADIPFSKKIEIAGANIMRLIGERHA